MRRLRERGLPVLLWAILISTILHFMFGPLIATLIYLHVFPTPSQMQPKPEEEVVTSTAIRIERRAHPRPAHPAKPRAVIRPAVKQQPIPKPRPRAIAVQTPPPETPEPPRAVNVTPQPRPRRQEEQRPQQRVLNAETIARQESEFAKTIAQARSEDNPVIGSRSTVPPASTKHYHLDFEGARGSLGQGQGYLEPIRAWHESGWTYYYVRYEVEYPDGTVETGVVPWPIHYPPGGDPFELGVRHLPLPGPPPGYEPPPGEDLHPLVKFCLEHHFEYCPIEHD
ncbi:MAG: hypothetical protein ACXWNK_18280 [Vulcanimicrobiaceae bacterium]